MKKRFENQHFYVPNSSATVFEFKVNSTPDQRINILVERMDEYYHIIESGTGRKIMMGSLIDLMKYLDKASGQWIVRKKKKEEPKRLFYNKDFSKYLLALGYTMIHVSTGLSWVWDKEYTSLIVSDGSIRSEDQLPPSGKFAIDFTQNKHPMTMKQVEAERTRAMEDEAEKAKRQREIEQKERRRVKEEAIKAAKQEQVERNNEKKNSTEILKPEIPVENDDSLLDSLLKIAGGIGIFLTGIGLGMFLDKKLN